MSPLEYSSPEKIYGELFYDIHRAGLFEDGKQFADAIARLHPSIILKTYLEERVNPNFDLSAFVTEYFDLPIIDNKKLTTVEKPITDHLHDLWNDLSRSPDKIKKKRTSKIPLPHSYIVPGGRFNEIYYWDSYFTMLGLKQSRQIDMIENMINNFKFLIDEFGFIPNGNRTYFLSRSQPPFYSLMVKLLIAEKGPEIIPTYISSLVKEYNFWMHGLKEAKGNDKPVNRVLKLENNSILNRYYDDKDTPREEMFRDDWKLKDFDDNLHHHEYRELRAACESGWDFSSRWLLDKNDLKTIMTTDLLPVDLNCLLWHLEKLISECYAKIGKEELSLNYGIIAHNRKKSIIDIFWNKEEDFFCDYNWKTGSPSSRLSLAGIYPLYFKLCTDEQALKCAEKIHKNFLRKGGVVTTPYETGQQWDAPNGWAPLQYMTIKGLLNYGHKSLAQEIGHRWVSLNKKVYQTTGKMLEKYNVEDIELEGGGGEYPVQDGFGWTNGVYLSLLNL